MLPAAPVASEAAICRPLPDLRPVEQKHFRAGLRQRRSLRAAERAEAAGQQHHAFGEIGHRQSLSYRTPLISSIEVSSMRLSSTISPRAMATTRSQHSNT